MIIEVIYSLWHINISFVEIYWLEKNYLLLFIFPVQSEHEADLQAYSVETVDILPLEGPCRGNLLATKGQRKPSESLHERYKTWSLKGKGKQIRFKQSSRLGFDWRGFQ